MPLIYLFNSDLMFSQSGPHTHDELDYLESLWERKEHVSLYDLMETYPTAIPLMRRLARQKLVNLKLQLEYLEVDRRNANSTTLGFLDGLQMLIEAELEEASRTTLVLAKKNEIANPSEITQEDVVRARNVPVKQFLKANASGKAKCLFHDDNEASMHLYKTNYYCFSCQAYGTSIDIIMKLKSVGFKASVAFLVGK